MPPSYDNLVTELETIDPEKLTLEFVKGRLLDEYNKRENSNDNTNGSKHSVAMFSNKNFFKCYRCNKVGHKSFELKLKSRAETLRQLILDQMMMKSR